jgi:hypothetical protein
MYWAFVAVAVISQVAMGQPQPGWSDQFATGDLNGGVVRCMADFDEDGPGPALPKLFAGGSFRTAGVGGPWVAAIARWDAVRWTDVGGSADLWFSDYDYGIHAMVVFDEDGPGPIPESLYVAGRGFRINGETGVFRWDGTEWTRVCAPPCTRPGVPIYDLAVFDEDGPGPGLPRLFAAGRIETGIWCWDGSHWSPTDESIYVGSGQFNALAVFDEDGPGPLPPALYAAGDISAGGNGGYIHHCAKWDGTTWSQVGDEFSGWIDDLAVFDPDGDYAGQGYLYATGYIHLPNYPSYLRHVRWDGNTWSPVPGVGQSYSDKLGVFDIDNDGPVPRSLVTNAFGLEYDLARWDGYQWTIMQNQKFFPQLSDCSAFGQFDDDATGGRQSTFLVCGLIEFGGIPLANGFAQWIGEAFTALGNGIPKGVSSLHAKAIDGRWPERKCLFAVGDLVTAGGVLTQAIAKWNGESWAVFGEFERWADVEAVESVDLEGDGDTTLLVVGGRFNKIAGLPCQNVAYWDGRTWSPAAASMEDLHSASPMVSVLAGFDADGPGGFPPSVFAGGRFSSIDGVKCQNIARWDGHSWSPVGGGITSPYWVSINSLGEWETVEADPRSRVLVVGGDFDQAGGAPASGIAAWNGDAWVPIGDAEEGGITSVVVVRPEDSAAVPEGLYVSGDLTFADQRRYQGIARYENGTWSLVAGVKSPDGIHWTPVGGIEYVSVNSMKVFDEDGPGGNPPHLFALGAFQFVGDGQQHALARWDGYQWTGFGTFAGNWGSPRSLEVFDEDADGPNPPGLYVGGQFNSVDGIQSVGIARWGLRVPYIARQPANLQRGVGESALFNVKAGGGDSLSYQWRLNGNHLEDGDRHAGAKTETLRVSNLRLSDRGQYDVVITNEAGLKFSNAVRLDVSCRSARITPDLNRDQSIDGHDIRALVDAMLIDDSDAGLCIADLNGDGMLDIADAAVLVDRLVRP